AELPPVGRGIAHQRRAIRVYHGSQIVFVFSNHHNYRLAKGLESLDGGGKESLTCGCRVWCNRWPGEQRFVRSHARGFAGGKDDCIEARRMRHEAKIAETQGISDGQFPIGHGKGLNKIENLGSATALPWFMDLDRIVVGARFTLAALEPVHMGQGSFSVTADGNQFSRNGYCNLFRSNGSDI